MADQWWNQVSGTILNPTSVVALFAGESAVSTLRQSCFRRKTAWLDIGIHPGQMSLASHILQCIPTPWFGKPLESKDLLLGIHTMNIKAKNLVDGAPRQLSSYMATVIYDKLMQAAHESDLRLIKREISRTESYFAFLLLQDHESGNKILPKLSLLDVMLQIFQIVSSVLNLVCLVISITKQDISGIIISISHIISRLLISLCIYLVTYSGPKPIETQSVPPVVLSLEVNNHTSTELYIAGSYETLNKFVLGEDTIQVFGSFRTDGEQAPISTFNEEEQNSRGTIETVWANLFMTDILFTLTVLLTSLASLSFLLLFQYTEPSFQVSSLISMLFGWFADNRLKMKTEEGRVFVENIPAGSQLIRVRAQSRALAIAILCLTVDVKVPKFSQKKGLDDDSGWKVKTGFLAQLPDSEEWLVWKSVLMRVMKGELTLADICEMEFKFKSDIVAAITCREQKRVQIQHLNGSF
ncbi:hypothetical protein BCR33DRAFT_720287 [Rhizoclosmatium globosum]|uniref:Uncharacterized protein n=1 Tax=Rhizoclosmatium globosum TaxID=329046 RepID=A0A1Y2BWA8_9FUNG|nr:hypothetical protein BCR33DRAFT_720287 [Rhizoclosmatium globosum]|eukprot:ORY39023.1 hypothetical protein BCR33DRAFT_720287 [Rhizoclosmatium globosum]